MINMGIIGLGYIGKVYLNTLLKIPGVKVKALIDKNISLINKLADLYYINILLSYIIKLYLNFTGKEINDDYNQKTIPEQIS